jgi:hypothetical protein
MSTIKRTSKARREKIITILQGNIGPCDNMGLKSMHKMDVTEKGLQQQKVTLL